ncbi:chromosome-associated kinesin KIF4 [Nematostella vectensis]|uniref:chromosome-associated kinesin KIF4 n=1 Tax=Nematostella vectensis TaxID=45351 RepID=UPI00207786F6|nr:chromosome-associated kinesin KIF4 [Nematostella vectensis]
MANIKVYARLFPCQNPSELARVEGNKLFISKSSVQPSEGQKNGAVNEHEIGITFNGIFGPYCSQSEVFGEVASTLVYKLFEGYNGTIFAYGQTGTGKTFTVEGDETGHDRSAKHGLIPQVLSLLFSLLEEMQDDCVSVQISFLEIYNELAYDLLGTVMPANSNKRDLPRVLVALAGNKTCITHGLSIHNAQSEYDARKLHLKGRMNKVMAETPCNGRSSRSHTIFTILLTRQEKDSEIVYKSKLNIVDLAGSERLSNEKSDNQRTRTKHINLSLHHLEGVIIALQKLSAVAPSVPCQQSRLVRCHSAQHLNTISSSSEDSVVNIFRRLRRSSSALNLFEAARKGISVESNSSYVPYRNSLLTMILQDSLGGNCNTTMIATLSLEKDKLKESISTCRFAQRVIRVVNRPLINKEINNEALIRNLKKEIVQLKKSHHDFKESEEMTGADVTSKCVDIIDGFLEGKIVDPIAQGINTPQKFHACLVYLRGLLRQTNSQEEATSSDEHDSGVGMNYHRGHGHGGLSENMSQGPRSPADTVSSSESNLMFGAMSHMASSRKHDVETQTTYTRQRRAATLSKGVSIHDMPMAPRRALVESIEKNNPRVTPPKTGRVTEKELKLWEMDIMKNNLIQRYKTLNSALATQRARVLVMEKHDGSPDDLENERLAEQHLFRKQGDVERKLSILMKDIAVLNSAHRSDRVVPSQPVLVQDSCPAFRERQLELRERSTQQKLLSCREQLKKGLQAIPMATSYVSMATTPIPTTAPPASIEATPEPIAATPKAVKIEPPQTGKLSCQEEGNNHREEPVKCSSEAGTSGSPGESDVFPKEIPTTAQLPSMASDFSRDCPSPSTPTRKRPDGYTPFSPFSRCGVNSIRRRSKYNQNLVEGMHRDEAGYRTSSPMRSQQRVSPGIISVNRLPATPARRPAAVTPSRSPRSASRTNRRSQGPVPSPRDDLRTRGNTRARRPATCLVRSTTPQSDKKHQIDKSSVFSYKLDQRKGFIKRGNDIVYRKSSFAQTSPSPDKQQIEEVDSKSGLTQKNPIPNEETAVAVLNEQHAAPMPVVQEEFKLKPPRLSPIGQENMEEQQGIMSARGQGVGENQRQDVQARDSETRQASPPTSPVMTELRRKQVDRAKRIREITSAVTVIQRAYKRHVRRRREGETVKCNETRLIP